jgi:RNA polymerase sigma factor (sigma-70 family)
MRGGAARDVLSQLRTLYRYGVTGHLSDEQLLDRFVARRDESGEEAFAELLRRHGPMVLAVCRRVLGDVHDAEDAFQATFLVLTRKATSVMRRDRVVSWLHGVAVRTAREARTRAARRRAREERVSKPVRVDPPGDEGIAELRAILDEEIARLPQHYQGALVLCELEGMSRPEAALRLGVPEGTLSSRLARAKAQLRDRLARRGAVLTAVTLSATLLSEARAFDLPLELTESIVAAATSVAAGSSAAAAISASVASLTEGVLRTMLLAKLKGTMLGIGTLAAIVSGAVVLAQTEPQSAPKVTEADRTAAVERKLDRILEALGRLLPGEKTPDGAKTGQYDGSKQSAHEPKNELAPLPEDQSSKSQQQAPLPEMPPLGSQRSQTGQSKESQSSQQGAKPQSVQETRNLALARLLAGIAPAEPAADVPQGSLADRLTRVEQRLQEVQQHVQLLAERLDSLEKLVGAPGEQRVDTGRRSHYIEAKKARSFYKPAEKAGSPADAAAKK